VPPLGCLPMQRTLARGFERKCVEKINNATMLYNDKLSKEIDSLKQSLSNSKIVYLDVYNPILDVIVNEQKYGNSKFQFVSWILLLLFIIYFL
jgi:hypothetical protein